MPRLLLRYPEAYRQESNLTEVERAARTLYLNRTCFNGLYRVNSLGQFNVPIGSYKNPRLFDEQSLRAASVALQDSIIETRDFRSIVEMAEPGDFFYFDPPYYPLGKTASFTGYTSKGFDDEDHRELAEVFTTLSRKGCLCMLSNSHTPFILDLYEGYRIESAKALRSINSNTGGRHAVAEIIVLNYWDRGK